MAKRDFGSFHASNVQELLDCDEDSYSPPTNPFQLPVFDFNSENNGHEHMVFGRKAKSTYFLLEEKCCFLNHGAFGAALKPALETAQKWQNYVERQPLRAYDRELFPLLVQVTRRLAKFVGCEPSRLALVNNATFGTNSILNSLTFKEKDVILSFNITYGSVKKLIHHICGRTGATNKEVFIKFPVLSSDEILNTLEPELGPNVKLLVVDHIPSNTPIVMPVKEIVQMCRKRGILVHIDGAHALGSLPLKLEDIDPDFYVSNAHKWLACPKGAAFLYVKPSLQHEIHPAVISHGYGSGFNSEFMWAGLHDYSPLLSLTTVLDFWEAAGANKIQHYCHAQVTEGAQLLTRLWQSTLAAPESMFGSMSLVKLPQSTHELFSTTGIDYNVAEKIQNVLYHKYNIEVPIKSLQGNLYARISAHIHNEAADYELLAQAILEITRDELDF